MKKKTTWYVVNIKSRVEQTPLRYVQAFEHINQEDPLILIRGNRYIGIRHFSKSNYLEEDGTYPRSLLLKLTTYDIVNPDAFYNTRSRENISMQWDPDVAINEKDVDLIFIPCVHRLVFRKNSPISLTAVLKFLRESLDRVEGEELFDVDVVKSHDMIQKILTSHEIYSINADISFSNADRSSNFIKWFDDKLRNSNVQRTMVSLRGSKEHPLVVEEDGLLEAVVKISESNGTVKAHVKQTKDSKVETIDTKHYPMVLAISADDHEDINKYLYNELKTKYGSLNNNEDGK